MAKTNKGNGGAGAGNKVSARVKRLAKEQRLATWQAERITARAEAIKAFGWLRK